VPKRTSPLWPRLHPPHSLVGGERQTRARHDKCADDQHAAPDPVSSGRQEERNEGVADSVKVRSVRVWDSLSPGLVRYRILLTTHRKPTGA
jgi:hypothetical protein